MQARLPARVEASRAHFPNPKGITAQSPGLRACELPWGPVNEVFNHNVVAAKTVLQSINPKHIFHPIQFRAGATRRAIHPGN